MRRECECEEEEEEEGRRKEGRKEEEEERWLQVKTRTPHLGCGEKHSVPTSTTSPKGQPSALSIGPSSASAALPIGGPSSASAIMLSFVYAFFILCVSPFFIMYIYIS